MSREGLHRYKKALAPLLQVAPSGFPSHARVRSALLSLHHKHKILPIEHDSAATVANVAADRFRIMCKDVHRLKRKQDKGIDVADLVSLIDTSSDHEVPPAVVPAQHGEIKFPDWSAMDQSHAEESDGDDDAASSESRVSLAFVSCQCIRCLGSIPIEIPSDGEQISVPVGSATNGGQSVETLRGIRRRLRYKQAAPGSKKEKRVVGKKMRLARKKNKKKTKHGEKQTHHEGQERVLNCIWCSV